MSILTKSYHFYYNVHSMNYIMSNSIRFVPRAMVLKVSRKC
jgi:hypothetical protein